MGSAQRGLPTSARRPVGVRVHDDLRQLRHEREVERVGRAVQQVLESLDQVPNVLLHPAHRRPVGLDERQEMSNVVLPTGEQGLRTGGGWGYELARQQRGWVRTTKTKIGPPRTWNVPSGACCGFMRRAQRIDMQSMYGATSSWAVVCVNAKPCTR